MDEKYLQDLYEWIKKNDSSYEGRYDYNQFKQKMQDFYFVRKGIGRALIRAGIENAGQAKKEIARARYEAELKLQQDFNREAAKHG